MGERVANPDRLAHFILRNVSKAIREFEMLHDGDRVAVAVSGGKDSLSLLELLGRLRHTSETRFELAAIHVLGDADGVTCRQPSLEDWLAGRGIPYRMVEPEIPADESLPLSCQRCTWLRRKALFLAANELGCNVVAYAHHADDVARTTLLNLLYVGSVDTLAPAAGYFGERFRLIRPLVYVPESELARYASAYGMPPPPPQCSRAAGSRRAAVTAMLKSMGRDYLTQARPNLIRVGLEGARARRAI